MWGLCTVHSGLVCFAQGRRGLFSWDGVNRTPLGYVSAGSPVLSIGSVQDGASGTAAYTLIHLHIIMHLYHLQICTYAQFSPASLISVISDLHTQAGQRSATIQPRQLEGMLARMERVRSALLEQPLLTARLRMMVAPYCLWVIQL